MPQTAPQPSATSTSPRPVTPTARRRAWGEPRVRIWLLTAGVILAIAIYWTISQLSTWYTENRLVRLNNPTQAKVYVPQDFNAGHRIENRNIAAREPVVIVWTHSDTEYRANAALNQDITSGQTVPIYIDPENPSDWTTRTEVPPLTGQLFGLAILLPAVLITALVAWLQHRRVISIYAHGEIHPAIVVETRSSALTPLSRQVRCTLQDLPDKRIVTVTLPNKHGSPARGDTIALITPPGGVTGSLAAAAYEA